MIRAFHVTVDGDLPDDEPAIMCNGCLRGIVFEFGFQPGDREMTIQIIRTVEKAGTDECPNCGQGWWSC